MHFMMVVRISPDRVLVLKGWFSNLSLLNLPGGIRIDNTRYTRALKGSKKMESAALMRNTGYPDAINGHGWGQIDKNNVYKKYNSTQKDDLPADPRNWSRTDVEGWLHIMGAKHRILDLKRERFLMNGKALCLMTVEMYLDRVPLGGKLLYKDFQIRLARAMYM